MKDHQGDKAITAAADIQPLLADIAAVVKQSRGTLKQTINTVMVQSYWQIGRLIVEHEQQGQSRAAYGKRQLQLLSQALTRQFGRGFDERNLRNMRGFYECYSIWNAVRTELSWTHYRSLIRIENQASREWYAQEAIEQSWSARALDRQIGVLYYERLLASKDRAVVEQEAQLKVGELADDGPENLNKHYLRDPYVLDFLDLPSQHLLESDIEQGIIDNLQTFLLELGTGFAFVGRQQRIQCDDETFYLDLVFYNYKLKCFLLIDLKLGKLTHQDIGQMDTYVRVYCSVPRSQRDIDPTFFR